MISTINWVWQEVNVDKRISLTKYKYEVWMKDSYTFEEWKLDFYNNWMKYSDFGDTSSGSGWAIDHILPFGDGGSNDVSNLRALNWKSNISRNRKNIRQTEIG